MEQIIKRYKRIQWVDTLRGVAMLLVIWGHIVQDDYLFFVTTSPFKMPLFFAITGYLFHSEKDNTMLFLKKLFFSIVIPWFILSLVWLKVGYAIVFGDMKKALIYVHKFFSGESLWFMPCIILAEIIHFCLLKNNNYKFHYFTAIVVSVFGLFLSKRQIGRFAMFDIACTAQFFLFFGRFFKQKEKLIRKVFKRHQIIYLIFIYIWLIIVSVRCFPRMTIDVHTNRYYNYPLCSAMIIISLSSLFLIMPTIKCSFRWMSFVGQNTIVFYIVHYYARMILKKISEYVNYELPHNIFGYIIEFAYVCVAMSFAAIVLNKWFPFAVGKGNRHDNKKQF